MQQDATSQEEGGEEPRREHHKLSTEEDHEEHTGGEKGQRERDGGTGSQREVPQGATAGQEHEGSSRRGEVGGELHEDGSTSTSSLRLHPDKNQNNQKRATELFKQLNAEYENWKRTIAQAEQRGRTQTAQGTYPMNFQFNPTYFESNFCGQQEPEGGVPQQAQQHSRVEENGKQESERTWISWLWGTRKNRQTEP